MSTVGRRTEVDAGIVAERVMVLADKGVSIEVIARKLGTSRYRVEKLVGGGPAGRDDVPYRYRELLARPTSAPGTRQASPPSRSPTTSGSPSQPCSACFTATERCSAASASLIASPMPTF